ncbi:class C sortase [Peptoniphilus raoultii]|uniref:class C sortase n=1 Tax=Peptoniphilus raoultii TaxID=1776387 RepID=UPI0008D98FD4|nr:class C sortase [Peptoniphilus raoultii]
MDKKKKRKTPLKVWILRFVFLLGFLIMLYPLVSRFYYRIEANNQVEDFDEGKKELTSEDIKNRIRLARAYNDSLLNVVSEDPYNKERLESGRAEYARMLEIHEKIGHVEIPKIGEDLPVYAGTSEEVLQKGVGHLEGTSLPIGGNSTHTVLTAHTGLPEARLFTDLTKMEIGDKFYIHNIETTLAYQVDQIKVVLPSEFNDLLIVEGHDYATLLTCTPIMINTHRLLVRGHRIDYVPEIEEKDIKEHRANNIYKNLFYASLVLILIMLILILRLRKKKKLAEKKLKDLNSGPADENNINNNVNNESTRTKSIFDLDKNNLRARGKTDEEDK